MKTILVCTVVSAAACSALSISSAQAGGRHHALGVSNSAASTTATSTGRSSLGEPVFLIPSTTSSSQGFVNSGREMSQRVSIARESRNAVSSSAVNNGTGRGTNVIFTPPPTIVGATASQSGVGNIAGNNVAERTFRNAERSSILDSGLGANPSVPQPDLVSLKAPQNGLQPSIVPVGPGPQGPPTLTPVTTTVQKSSPTVQVPTTSSAASTSSSAANGH